MGPVAAIFLSVLLLMQAMGGLLPRACGAEACGVVSVKACCCGQECACCSVEELPPTEPFPLPANSIEQGRHWLDLAESAISLVFDIGKEHQSDFFLAQKTKTPPIGFREPIFRWHRALLI